MLGKLGGHWSIEIYTLEIGFVHWEVNSRNVFWGANHMHNLPRAM